MTIACIGTASQRWAGAIGAITIETRLGSQVIAVTSAVTKHRHRTVIVANHAYSLAGGTTITVHLRLNGAGRFLRARFHKLPVKVTVTQTGQSHPISIRKLIVPQHKPKHRKH